MTWLPGSKRRRRLSEKQIETKKTAEASLVEKASSYTVESIIKGLANVNIYVGNALTDLSRELTAEANKLTEIRAITIETKHLEELHDIGWPPTLWQT
jgi:hypothetical protein